MYCKVFDFLYVVLVGIYYRNCAETGMAATSAALLHGRAQLRRAFSTRAAVSAASPRVAALREQLQQDLDATTETSWTDSAIIVAEPVSGRVQKQHVRHPDWLRVQRPGGDDYMRIRNGLRASKLATVCEEARCPNIGECWSSKKGAATATIMILGDTCTRGCRFCNVKTSRRPPLPAADEPEKTAEAIASWEVDYVVITSVDRDDIADGGAEHYARTVRRIKELKPSMRLECLTPDFNGTSGLEGVATVARAGLDVYAHNIETVERLQSTVRDRRAGYRESLAVLEHARVTTSGLVTKSSIMLGHGEEPHELRQTMRDLLNAGVEIFTLGQYLRPSRRHMKVARMVPPEEYEAWREEGLAMGFKYVASGPLVRSSYKAGEVFMEAFLKKRDRGDGAGVTAQVAGGEGGLAAALPLSQVWKPTERAARVLEQPKAACPM